MQLQFSFFPPDLHPQVGISTFPEPELDTRDHWFEVSISIPTNSIIWPQLVMMVQSDFSTSDLPKFLWLPDEIIRIGSGQSSLISFMISWF